jgi:hypothetical protein
VKEKPSHNKSLRSSGRPICGIGVGRANARNNVVAVLSSDDRRQLMGDFRMAEAMTPAVRILLGILITSLLCVALNQPAKAEMLQGIGSTNCGEFAKMYRGDPKETELFYFGWAQGFMSALNFSNAIADDYLVFRDLGSTKEQMATIRTYCNQHPLADYYSAVLEVYKTLPWQRIKRKPQ